MKRWFLFLCPRITTTFLNAFFRGHFQPYSLPGWSCFAVKYAAWRKTTPISPQPQIHSDPDSTHWSEGAFLRQKRHLQCEFLGKEPLLRTHERLECDKHIRQRRHCYILPSSSHLHHVQWCTLLILSAHLRQLLFHFLSCLKHATLRPLLCL